MTNIQQSLRDSKAARWGALAVVSFTMMTGYYINYVISPLKPLLEEAFGWTSVDFGLWNSAYGWFNVFFLMLIFGGIILDKIGVRFTGLGAALTMLVGTVLQYAAIEGLVPIGQVYFEGVNINLIFTSVNLEMKSQIFYGALGFGIFGVGVEIAGITVSKIIVKWFKGKELALAMGLEMATARMGTALALALPYPIATAWFGTEANPALSAPVMLGLGLLVAGFVAFLWYTSMDRKLEVSEGIKDEVNEEDEFKISDILTILTNKGFWLIAFLCVLFYSGVFPFLYYATDLMINKYNVDPEFAGTIPGLLPFGTILLTPLFGNIYDRKGKGATIMLIGSAMLLVAHTIFAIPFITNYIIAIAIILFLGVTFSLVPSAMWPSVPKIIPEKQLGTAYALIFWVQNWGLMGVPLLIGWALDYSNPEVLAAKAAKAAGDASVIIPAYNYTLPMILFASTGFLAIIVALLLKAEDKKKGYGLELPNIEDKA
jgi:MFS family permease